MSVDIEAVRAAAARAFVRRGIQVPGRYTGITDGEAKVQGIPSLFCFPEVGGKAAPLGEAEMLAIAKEVAVETGFSVGDKRRTAAMIKRRFAEAGQGKRWTHREVRDAWRASITEDPDDVVALLERGMMSAFPAEED